MLKRSWISLAIALALVALAMHASAAPAFSPADTCTSCTVTRGCFACGSTAPILEAPCAITICCGVVRGEVCGTCSDHCVPPPS